MKKGFTLIELLAVIVILAIIAVIAVPIVITIINDSASSTTTRSGEFYLDAVENAIAKENMKTGGNFNPTDCTIKEDGNVRCGDTELIIEIDGERPTNGFITYNEGILTDAEIGFSDDSIVINSIGNLAKKNDIVCTKVNEETKTTGNIPNGEFLPGDEYLCKVKDNMEEGYENGYRFFVLSTQDDNVNLILEKNINNDGTLATTGIGKSGSTNGKYNLVEWISQKDYNDDANFGDIKIGNHNKGPITVINFLNKATESWENIPNLNETYEDENLNYDSKTKEISFGNPRYEIITLTGKARLPKVLELLNAGCTPNECKKWLYDFQTGPVKGEEGYGIYGYGTLSTYLTGSITRVHHTGNLQGANPATANGVRPVITIPKSAID